LFAKTSLAAATETFRAALAKSPAPAATAKKQRVIRLALRTRRGNRFCRRVG
jgi:hypothetical protein